MPSLFVRCAFPAQEPDGPVWSRQDGDWLLMLSGGSRKNPTTGKAELSGLPYGKLPRLILLEIATQVVRTGRREVRLGDTMSAIVRQLGLKKGGGSKGPNARLRDQLDRVFRAQITLERTVKVGDNRERQEWQNRRMVKSAGLLWQLDSPGEPLGEDSHIVLDDDFYREILRHSVPVDGGAARSLIHGARGSCLAYDLYLWLAARVARGGQNPRTLIRYSEMRNHLGLAGYEGQAGADNFRRKMREALTAVLAVWPEAAAGSWFTAEKDGLVLNLPAAQPPVVVQPAKARVIELDVAPALVETLDGAAPRQRVQAPAD